MQHMILFISYEMQKLTTQNNPKMTLRNILKFLFQTKMTVFLIKLKFYGRKSRFFQYKTIYLNKSFLPQQ